MKNNLKMSTGVSGMGTVGPTTAGGSKGWMVGQVSVSFHGVDVEVCWIDGKAGEGEFAGVELGVEGVTNAVGGGVANRVREGVAKTEGGGVAGAVVPPRAYRAAGGGERACN